MARKNTNYTKHTKKRKKIYYVAYHKTRIPLSKNPRTGKCVVPHKTTIKRTNIHHWRYIFYTSAVVADPAKVLENTVECCFYHHKIADAMRVITEAKKEDVLILTKSMDSVTKKAWLETLRYVLDNV